MDVFTERRVAMWAVYIFGSLFIIMAVLMSMCVVAGWADEDMQRMMDEKRKENGKCTERTELR